LGTVWRGSPVAVYQWPPLPRFGLALKIAIDLLLYYESYEPN